LPPAPYWTTYPRRSTLAGGVPVEVFAGEDQGYLVTVEAARSCADGAHQGPALLLSQQPDRRGPLPEQLRDRAVALDHGVWVITDEIYEHLTYEVRSSARCRCRWPELADTCIVVNGVARPTP